MRVWLVAPRVSIIIPTLNAAGALPPSLDALLEGVEQGLVRELIVVDGGSEDATRQIADDVGAEILACEPGRGAQLALGGRQAKGEWLLFLHADTHLEAGWSAAAAHHMQSSETAAVFRLAFRARGLCALVVSGWANLRTRLFDLPYGDQGLLISRALYDQVGGYPALPLMEDVAIARALKGQLTRLDVEARTSAEKYLRDGWLRRGARNLVTLCRYFAGADPEGLARAYQKQ